MDSVDNLRVTMVKKRLENGEPCPKCAQAEEMLRRRGLWEQIDEVVLALEGQADSPGMQLAARLGVDVAPFFIVAEADGSETVYRSALKLVRERLQPRRRAGSGDSAGAAAGTPAGPPKQRTPDRAVDAAAAADALAGKPPADILAWALAQYRDECAIAFSGAEDVVLIDMAAETGIPFAVFCLDTGRLHPETYEFIETVRNRYGVAIDLIPPEPAPVRELVRTKGLFSFYEDGHEECCDLRKVAPLTGVLRSLRAWITGQRRDQNPTTRAEIAVVEPDRRFAGAGGSLCKVNPLAAWTAADVWAYIHERGVPYNPLHDRGYRSIGCAPCTRPVAPGRPDRDGRWWWEQAEHKECGLHVARPHAHAGK